MTSSLPLPSLVPHESGLCVAVTIRHPVMRQLVMELLRRAGHRPLAVAAPAQLAPLTRIVSVDAAVVDGADFPDCCLAHVDRLLPGRVVVVGPEPDPAYESAASRRGAGAWVVRDDLGMSLLDAIDDVVRWCPAPSPVTRLVRQALTSGGTPMGRDPVCGMDVQESEAAATSQYAGRTFYFCSESCKAAFDQQPDAYADSE